VSPTHRPGGCSGWSTTAPPTAARHRSTDSKANGPNLRLVHLPLHTSWLNQIEIYFSILQRKVVAPNDFTDLAEVQARLLALQRRYQQTAVPFDWRFTRGDLVKLLRRLDEHEQFAIAA
jgi:hypothetical protein